MLFLLAGHYESAARVPTYGSREQAPFDGECPIYYAAALAGDEDGVTRLASQNALPCRVFHAALLDGEARLSALGSVLREASFSVFDRTVVYLHAEACAQRGEECAVTPFTLSPPHTALDSALNWSMVPGLAARVAERLVGAREPSLQGVRFDALYELTIFAAVVGDQNEANDRLEQATRTYAALPEAARTADRLAHLEGLRLALWGLDGHAHEARQLVEATGNSALARELLLLDPSVPLETLLDQALIQERPLGPWAEPPRNVLARSLRGQEVEIDEDNFLAGAADSPQYAMRGLSRMERALDAASRPAHRTRLAIERYREVLMDPNRAIVVLGL
jgi:hypothetical protein